MKSKYIIKRQGREVPIVFPAFLTHNEVAGISDVKSAGFCELTKDGNWIAEGGSFSMKLNARPQDAAILMAHFLV